MLANMPVTDWISLAACIGHLALALVVLLRGAGNPLRVPLVLISLDFFVWNFAQWAHRTSGNEMWHWLDTTFSPIGPPLVFHFVTVFVGRSRKLRPVVIAAFAGFGVLSLWSASGFFGSELVELIDRKVWWSNTFLVLLGPTVAATVALLVSHLRRATTFTEQMSTRLLIAAVIVGNLLGATELWEQVFPAGGLGNVGTLASTVLVAIIVLRYRLLPKSTSVLLPLYALTVGVLGVFSYLVVFSLLGAHIALLVFGTSIITLVLAVAARDIFAAVATSREQTRQLATLGRFSAQLAHDVRNPLSALKGALQFLLEERDQGRSIDGRRDFIELSLEQVDRIEALVAKYQRLGAVTPDSKPVILNELLSSVWAGIQSARDVSSVTPRIELTDSIPECRADSDLLGVAVQNVILNALDAMPDGGTLTLQTRTEGEETVIVVTDTGIGMDSREQERAFDDFFTTKANGSGLGLGFVQRVVAAHGGELELDSQPGTGTTVRIRLPNAIPMSPGEPA
ncbi:ATP-binding protein [Myxococcota bacterium]